MRVKVTKLSPHCAIHGKTPICADQIALVHQTLLKSEMAVVQIVILVELVELAVPEFSVVEE